MSGRTVTEQHRLALATIIDGYELERRLSSTDLNDSGKDVYSETARELLGILNAASSRAATLMSRRSAVVVSG